MNDVSTIELADKEITDSITDCIFSIDNNFNFTYCNKASENYSGKKRSEILGFNYFQIFPFHSTTVFKNKFKYALDNQKAVSFLYETNFSGKELLSVSVYPFTSGLTLLIKSSRESLFLGLPREELFQDTLNNMLEGCAVIDYNWCYLYMNDTYASQVSVSKSTSIGKKITDVIKEIEKSIF